MTEPAGRADILIVGGGPAGMMAGLLFARAGLRTIVLEKHGDFLRDFRGDTVHPSTLRAFHDLGLLGAFLERPHDKVRQLSVTVGDAALRAADFTGFDPRWNFVAMVPQWEFLDFLADQARLYPHFSLRMRSEGLRVIEEHGRIAGLVTREEGREVELRARLVIAADGRRSILRESAGFEVRSIGAPMDVFWFSIPKARTTDNRTTGYFRRGRILALIDRGDYWQCGYVFAKGGAEAIRARGLEAFRESIAQAAPVLADGVNAIQSWNDVKLLTVALDRLDRCWHRPGMLVIGDAAHAMSPVGGVGINLAIQDAVAAANLLAGAMARGEDVDPLLPKLRARRMPAVRIVQAFQNAVQKRIIGPLLEEEGPPPKPPLPLRLLDRFAPLRRLPAAFIGFGPRTERVRSPSV